MFLRYSEKGDEVVFNKETPPNFIIFEGQDNFWAFPHSLIHIKFNFYFYELNLHIFFLLLYLDSLSLCLSFSNEKLLFTRIFDSFYRNLTVRLHFEWYEFFRTLSFFWRINQFLRFISLRKSFLNKITTFKNDSVPSVIVKENSSLIFYVKVKFKIWKLKS